MDGSDQPISMTSARVFLPRVWVEWSGHNYQLESLTPYSSPLNHLNVLCQTQHLRHFLRGRLFFSFSFISLTRSQVTTRYVDLQPVGMGASSIQSLSILLTLSKAHSG